MDMITDFVKNDGKKSYNRIRRGSAIDWPHIMVDGIHSLTPEYVWVMHSLINKSQVQTLHGISLDQQVNMGVLLDSARILSNATCSLPRSMRLHQSIMRQLLINIAKYPNNWQTMRQPKWWKIFTKVKNGKLWLRIHSCLHQNTVILGEMLDRYNIMHTTSPCQEKAIILEREKECCICLNATDTDSFVTFSCLHACCVHCTFKLLSHTYSQNKRCPICRANIVCVHTIESNLNVHSETLK
jgi:hypothetical protein